MKISRNNFVLVFLILVLILLFSYLFSNNRQKKQNYIEVNCSSYPSKYECWRDSLKKTLTEEGLAESFTLLAKFYDTEPGFTSECHGFTHELGEEAYKQFKKNEDLNLTPHTSYCGYGFYHGFMETLLYTNGSIKDAQDFCTYADKKLSQYNKKTTIACYHGIGHGAVDGSGESKWNNPQDFISQGLKICKTLSTNPDQVYQCGTGVFNSLAIAMNSNSVDINFKGNPYNICFNQEDSFKRSCYEQLNTRVSMLSQGDLQEGARYVSEISEKKYAINAMEQLAPATIASRVGKNQAFTKEINVCKSLPDYLRKSCIEGLAGGILEFGKPDFEYLESINLCNSKDMDSFDKKNCYDYVTSSLNTLYSREKVKEICSTINPEYRKYCENQP